MENLRTQRLILRKVVPQDTRSVYENWASDPDVARYLTWYAHKDISETVKFMKSIQNRYLYGDKYIYGIELASDGTLIGMIDVVAYPKGFPEIGYCSGKKWWGNGYMTEALQALVEKLCGDGFEKIVIGAVRENIGSNRVIQKVGFTQVGSETHELSSVKHEIVTINIYNYRKSDQKD